MRCDENCGECRTRINTMCPSELNDLVFRWELEDHQQMEAS